MGGQADTGTNVRELRADRYPCFDGLRALAAVTVFVFHAGYRSLPRSGALWSVIGRLDVGVAIFFAISGFLLYRPFVVANRSGRPGPNLRAYFTRRLLRIFPAYWVALFVTAYLLDRVTFVGGASTAANFGLVQMYSARWSFLQGMDQAWTLCVELTFYVALPIYAAAVAWVSRRAGARRTELIGLALVSAAGFGAYLVRADGHEFATWVTVLPINIPLFASGMILAIVSVELGERGESPGWLTRITDRPGLLFGAAALAYAAMVAVLWGTAGVLTYTGAERTARYVLWCAIGFFTVAIAALGRQDAGFSRRVLRWRPIAYVGVISYGIYLWHEAVLGEIYDQWLDPRHGVRPFAAMLVVGFVVTCVIASISWFGLERPLMRLARRPRRSGSSPGPVPMPSRPS